MHFHHRATLCPNATPFFILTNVDLPRRILTFICMHLTSILFVSLRVLCHKVLIFATFYDRETMHKYRHVIIIVTTHSEQWHFLSFKVCTLSVHLLLSNRARSIGKPSFEKNYVEKIRAIHIFVRICIIRVQKALWFTAKCFSNIKGINEHIRKKNQSVLVALRFLKFVQVEIC